MILMYFICCRFFYQCSLLLRQHWPFYCILIYQLFIYFFKTYLWNLINSNQRKMCRCCLACCKEASSGQSLLSVWQQLVYKTINNFAIVTNVDDTELIIHGNGMIIYNPDTIGLTVVFYILNVIRKTREETICIIPTHMTLWRFK